MGTPPTPPSLDRTRGGLIRYAAGGHAGGLSCCPTFDCLMSSSVTCREIKSFHLQNEYCMIPAGLGTLLATFGICSSVPPTPPSPSAAETSQSFLQGIKSVITSLKKCRDKFHYVLGVVRLLITSVCSLRFVCMPTSFLYCFILLFTDA